MDILKKFMPPTTPRPQNYHHYVCFGNAHVKFATFIIILFRLLFTLLFGYYLLTGHAFYKYSTEMIYDLVELLALIFLIFGYINEDSKWTWPYMAIEFSSLILALMIYMISISAIIIPDKYSDKWTYQGKTLKDSSEIRKYALKLFIESAIGAALFAFEISVLLACNRYFDDEKARKKDLRERPIILNQDGDHQHGGGHNAIIDMEPVMDTVVAVNVNQNRGFGNPNFSLVDSEDENDHDHDWHSKDKKANILA